MSLTIRKESRGDIEAIEKVTIEAFLNAPHTDHTEHYIVRELRNSDALSISLIAESQGVLIGHVAVSPVTISDGSRNWFGLGPISVSPHCQSSGVGSTLILSAIEGLKILGLQVVLFLVIRPIITVLVLVLNYGLFCPMYRQNILRRYCLLGRYLVE